MRNNKIGILFILLSVSFAFADAQDSTIVNKAKPKWLKIFGIENGTSINTEPKKKWYDYISIRGYGQFRYNRLGETNENLKCEQCDRSWGKDGGFFVRRLRIILFGNLGSHVYFYIQPDFASSASASGLHFGQLRDAYVDISIDKKNEFRFRIGQSKVPYGFENMQSSQNRLALDRNDALNSAVSNERDLGVFFYWAPQKIRQRFSMLVNDGFKGSGDYGVIGLGVYNGQTANRPELNKQPHVVGSVAYPFEIGSQIVEPSVQGYWGNYIVPKENLSSGVKYLESLSYKDARVAGSLVLYPRPFGVQFEYTYGMGPEFNKATDSIEVMPLHGGYLTLSYMARIKSHFIYPFVRMQYYDGGKKHEKDARSYTVKELEIGIEYQPIKYFEFVAMYTLSSRRFEDYSLRDNFQNGGLLRLQAQFNF
jgi:hypothetical protein